MKLNKTKCKFTGIGNTGSVNLADGQPVKAVEEAKYLGCMLNRKDDAETDVRKRILDCTITIKRLHIFFYGTDCSTRRKLHVYSAVVRSKLMYGLETAMLNKSVLNRLDAFQMKGLRKIMKMQHTYYNRTHTNQNVLN